MPKLGHVSASAYVSPTLGHPISLGFCAQGRERIGETVWALSPLFGQRLRVRLGRGDDRAGVFGARESYEAAERRVRKR